MTKMLLPDMKYHFLLTIAVFAASKFVHQADSTSKSSDLRLVVLSNGVAILPCESTADASSIVQYSWTKDNLPIDVGNDGRIQITNEGHLLLRDAMEDDSGVYVCQAITNNDIVEVNVTLIVLVPDAPPFFTNFTLPNVTLERSIGSSVILRCPVKGHPIPEIIWYKDGVYMDDPMARDPDTETKLGKFSVTLHNLRLSDSGNYTCVATNELGTVNGSFHLHISNKEKGPAFNSTRPDLSVFHPLNTTVKYGSSATFQCRVRSEAPPNIQWLKKIEDSELQTLQTLKGEHDIIKVQGENYRVLQSSEVVERSDGSFLNKLTIPEVFEADSGKYICLGANSMGYSFRSAYLTVLPRPHALPLGWSRSVAVHPGHPSSILIAIPITLGIAVGCLVASVVLCHRRRMGTSVPLPASGYRKECLKKSACTADTSIESRDEKQFESPNLSADEAEDYKEGPSTSCLHSEVELEGSGAVVTKLCLEQNSSNNYDGCFIMRNDV